MNYPAIEAIAAAATALVAVAGVIVARRIANRADEINKATNRIASIGTLHDWRRDIRAWGAEVVGEMSSLEAQVLAADHARVQSPQLSALIDRGRFFFPNQDRDKYGLHKPPACRGLRHAVLDPIVAAYGVAANELGTGTYPTRYEAVSEMRRQFVSRIQTIIAPELQNAEITRLIDESSGSPDPTLGGLLPSKDEVPSGAQALLHGGYTSPNSKRLPANER